MTAPGGPPPTRASTRSLVLCLLVAVAVAVGGVVWARLREPPPTLRICAEAGVDLRALGDAARVWVDRGYRVTLRPVDDHGVALRLTGTDRCDVRATTQPSPSTSTSTELHAGPGADLVHELGTILGANP